MSRLQRIEQSVRVAEGVLLPGRPAQRRFAGRRSIAQHRHEEIVTWLDEFDADVVCLQEVSQDDGLAEHQQLIAERAPATGVRTQQFGS